MCQAKIRHMYRTMVEREQARYRHDLEDAIAALVEQGQRLMAQVFPDPRERDEINWFVRVAREHVLAGVPVGARLDTEHAFFHDIVAELGARAAGAGA